MHHVILLVVVKSDISTYLVISNSNINPDKIYDSIIITITHSYIVDQSCNFSRGGNNAYFQLIYLIYT